MVSIQDIRSLTDFQRNTKAHLKRLKATGRPEVLTINGKAEIIVQDAAAYELMVEAFRGIEQGLEEMQADKGRSARRVLDRIRAGHRIPRSLR